MTSTSAQPFSAATRDVLSAIAREPDQRRWPVLVRDWWLAGPRSREEVRAVLRERVWFSEPCRHVSPDAWVAIWRHAGFIDTAGLGRPAKSARVYRAAEPGFARSLSWTPERGYAEFWRYAGKAPTLEDAAARATELLTGAARARTVNSPAGEPVHLWSATVAPEGILAVLTHHSAIEYVVDPAALVDVERIEPDLTLAAEFQRRFECDAHDLPDLATDGVRTYVRDGRGYREATAADLAAHLW